MSTVTGGTIGKTLKEARIRKGLSQKALAGKLGWYQDRISKVESGVYGLKVEDLEELLRLLDLELVIVPRHTRPAVISVTSQKPLQEERPAYVASGDEEDFEQEFEGAFDG